MKTVIRSCLAIGALLATTAIHASGQAPATAPRQLEIVAKDRLPKPPAPRDARTAYLMTYFTDEDHSLHFATSRDGYSFTDVNGGKPVMSGREAAEQKGIRDPHIMRGPDGGFYMSMTDLHIFAKREGLRDTQWERPEEQYSWGNNRNMIFMKSYDLIHWSRSRVTPSAMFPRYRNAGNMWAPETIYDPKRKALMVYFTTRDGNGPNYLVYSYADKDFSTLTEEPKTLFDYPDPKVNVIDADITKVGDKYHMFYVAHQAPGNIRHSESSSINSGWTKDLRKVDPETVGTEAPTLWKRSGTNTYVLMYDVFGINPNNMGFSETTDFVTYRNIGRFNEPGSPMKATNFARPKHGAVVAISPVEATRLERYFAAR